MNKREDNLQIISNMLGKEYLAKVVAMGYSDRTLEFMSAYAPTTAAFADTKFSTATVEKLLDAKDSGLIDSFDVSDIMGESVYSKRNEAYIGDFLRSVDNTLSRRAAVQAFIAANNEDISFNEIANCVNSGAYGTNSYGQIQLSSDLAREMYDMGFTLTACRENTYRYMVKDIEVSLNMGDFVVYQKHKLAMDIEKMRHKPDWSAFRDYIRAQMGRDVDRLTSYIFGNMYLSFQKEVSKSKFADKVAGEYEQYISDLKKKDPNVIIRSAYEIYNKDYIVDFCNTNDLNLDLEELQILLDTDSVLDEIYQEWDSMTQLNGLAEIDTAIEDTAYRLKSEAEQRKAEEMNKSAEGLDNAPTPAKPKRKPRL